MPLLRHDRFGGQVVAKLPFEPVSFIRGISHRGLPGEDWTDCSFAFICALCCFSLSLSLCK